MSKPRRIQLSRAKGWRRPENTVSVARPSKYGNPYRVVWHRRCPGLCYWRVELWHASARGVEKMVIRQFAGTPAGHAEAIEFSVHWFEVMTVATLDLTPLRGKNLACWCPLDQPCHADVLLRHANDLGVLRT